MKKLLLATVAALLLAMGTAQATNTLTLACEGTVKDIAEQSERVSIGIIVNFSNQTIIGLSSNSRDDVAKITYVTETNIAFAAHDPTSKLLWTAIGDINRITGHMEAMTRRETTGDLYEKRHYSLECKPAQRMF